MIGFITGSGSEELHGAKKQLETPWGAATVYLNETKNGQVALISRHGDQHQLLPHHINYRANIWALKELGCLGIISLSVVGALNPDINLGELYLIKDLYYPDNRLPNGEACTLFSTPGQPDRGHLIAGSLFHEGFMKAIEQTVGDIDRATYAYAIGPRFNTKLEIKAFQHAGADLISQTCGPEAVLANEAEIPYAMLCFAIDYANGVLETPTSIEELQGNLAKSAKIFQDIISYFPRNLTYDHKQRSLRHIQQKNEETISFSNFVYRFE